MKASDYIVECLINKGITDVFGYPGGMVTHLMDSFSKYADRITPHVTYNEQGAAMAACGYAQASGKIGVAYATSGPGATNLITGICNAYMDSIPVIFLTGQVNSFEQKGNNGQRQRGFQETDIVSMVRTCTKYAVQVNHVKEMRAELEKAFQIANQGRKGPVLLDIAMDVFRSDIPLEEAEECLQKKEKRLELRDTEELAVVQDMLSQSKRPVILIGNGLTRDERILSKLNGLNIPVVSSMLAVDAKSIIDNFYGFIGAYGHRTANFLLAKSDLVISFGARLDIRQVGAKRKQFIPGAKLIRIDLDQAELGYKVHDDEVCICEDALEVMKSVIEILKKQTCDYKSWMLICDEISSCLDELDNEEPNQIIKNLSRHIPENSVITTDVGQNQVWVAQSFCFKKGQRALFSGGLGAMGYSLPAAIGACIAKGQKVYSFNGDGGIQMNIQELQVLSRESLPIKIIVLNNYSLGMIRHFQEMYFDGNYSQTVKGSGYTAPKFQKLADAYDLEYCVIENISDIDETEYCLNSNKPALLEVKLSDTTYVFPKIEYGKQNQDQEPLLDRSLYQKLMLL